MDLPSFVFQTKFEKLFSEYTKKSVLFICNYIHFFVLLIQELQKLGICSDDPRLKGTLYELGQ